MALPTSRRNPDFHPLAEAEKGFAEEIAENGYGHCYGGEGLVSAQAAEDGGGFVDCSGDGFGVCAVGGVPVAAVEDADCGGVIFFGEGAEEANEAYFIVDLGVVD